MSSAEDLPWTNCEKVYEIAKFLRTPIASNEILYRRGLLLGKPEATGPKVYRGPDLQR